MSIKNRFHIDLNRHIMNMFENTVDGKTTVYLTSEDGLHVDPTSFKVGWTRADAEGLTEKFLNLLATLKRIGELHRDTPDDSEMLGLLSEEEAEIYKTFILPYDTCPVDLALVNALFERARSCDDLTDEENDILERHGEWQESEALRRLPFLKKNPHEFILRGRRFERLVSLGAIETVINEEARCLAEEMVLYHFFEKDPDNIVDKILSDGGKATATGL